jgi:hypothetical protein
MYAAYGANGEFNIAAQVQAFAARARDRGVPIAVVCEPLGRHDTATGIELLPADVEWLGVTSLFAVIGRLGPFDARGQ